MGHKTLLERFEEKYIPLAESGCWLWVGSLNRKGYGNLRDGSIIRSAHRVSYELYKGEINGETIDHICNVRSCVNPDHLRVMSMRDNILRGNNPPAINARKAECINGHSLSGDNLGIRKVGGRYCNRCCTLNKRRRRGSKLPHYDH